VSKNFYELLDVDPSAPAEEIKRAFRKEIARYHPDKVQHLGREFQEIAAVKSAELTEAYRILMDPSQRSEYDEQLRAGGPAAPVRSGGPPTAQAPAATARPATPPAPDPPADPEPDAEERGGSPDPAPAESGRDRGLVFVRRAAVAKVRTAIEEALGSWQSIPARDFDLGYLSRPRGLFKKAEAPVRVLARFVPQVDAAAVKETWPQAVKVGAPPGGVLCVFLMGVGLAPQRELATVIADQRRRPPRGTASAASPVLVPLDVRDWDAFTPTDAPPAAKRILDRLRQK
jgi:curved DNA-binding protein CbpA